MQIHVVNPNTSAALTRSIEAAARRAAAQGTRIVAAGSSTGPASIESAFDEAMALPGLLLAVREGERANAHAHVIACFGDPGLTAARELARVPVIGIAEAAMHVACLLAPSFSVVTTLERTVGSVERLALRYGFERQCRRVRATGLDVLALEHATEDAALGARIEQECRRALHEDRSEAIVLGCAGMALLADRLAEALGVPVIDGVTAGVKLAEALAGWHPAKRGEHAPPPDKPFSGALAAIVGAAR